MNVLIYSGPGASKTCVSHTLSAMKSLLFPHYDVQIITPLSIEKHDWTQNCALFIMPGGRDLPYVSSLAKSTDKIKSYVQNGGKYLGLCAGAYYASRRVEWEVGTPLEVSGDRALKFFPGVHRGCVYPGFTYESEEGARPVQLDIINNTGETTTRLQTIYYNGGGEFVDAEKYPDVRIMAKYVDGDAQGKTAAVYCEVGNGRAVLWAIHPEYPLTSEPLISAISRYLPEKTQEEIRHDEKRRVDLLRTTLLELGLHVVQNDSMGRLRVRPQFLTSITAESGLTALTARAVKEHITDGDPSVLKDAGDTFQFRTWQSSADFSKVLDTTNAESVREVFILPDGVCPSRQETPSFDLQRFYRDLNQTRESPNGEGKHWHGEARLGDLLLYGEIVTSTQTMLDKNPALMSAVPVPLVSLASHQISGRGRGSNSWLSPPGCLQFSILLRLSLLTVPASKLVFIQYLFGLAVTEACRKDHALGQMGENIRLKWPNDIYVVSPISGELRKIGGILVNTSFMGTEVNIIIGCGLNVLNSPPIMSLSQLVPPGQEQPSMETTASKILVAFESLWSEFIKNKGSFDSFMDLYLDRWLHSDQEVLLATSNPPVRVRIIGITPDHGLLRTVPEFSTGWPTNATGPYIDLQPDGNSFDLMSGLIRTKT